MFSPAGNSISREQHCAPTGRGEYFRAPVYKHFVPNGTTTNSSPPLPRLPVLLSAARNRSINVRTFLNFSLSQMRWVP
jgi:hypothetical protein